MSALRYTSMLTRAPTPALRPFVQMLWASNEDAAGCGRELVLPTGAVHVVVRLSDEPLRVFSDADDLVGRSFTHAVVGGARGTAYVRDVSEPIRSVGAQLRPGAASLLLGVPADELADRHTSLEDLLGTEVRRLRQRLLDAQTLESRLSLYEGFLVSRLPTVRGVQPVVAHALGRLGQGIEVAEVVRESGYSHGALVTLFRRHVGLTPKLYARIRRLCRALELARDERALPWARIAVQAGYSDQPHLSREFRELAGLTPREYARSVTGATHHVPLSAGRRR